MVGLYRDQPTPAALAKLITQLDPDRSATRRLGPLVPDEVAQVLAIYCGQESPRDVAGGVLARAGGVPLLVHQAASDLAQRQAAEQVDQAAGQTGRSRIQLRTTQARLADNVVDLRELREHGQQLARLATDQDLPDAATDDRPAAAVCPYKGLARFEADDAEFYFGRERLTAQLVARLVGAALVGVVGPSGSGKSSLLRAGLLPALRDGALPGSDRWRQLIIRPGEHPLRELARALGVHDERHGMLVGATEDAGPQGRLLLVVDQFEEVFTACQDRQEQTRFLDELLAAATGDHGAIVVLGIRADYYGRCAEHPELAQQLAASQVLVGPMDAQEVRRAIELPARRAGLRVEPALSKAMVADVAGEPGGLPLLSTALLECWERRQGRTLTLAGYRERGGVQGAVARLAERAYLALDPEEQAAARRLLLRLAGPGEGQAVTRRRVPLAELELERDRPTARALEVLTARRLLTKGEGTVEVAHEALLREWPRLRGWLEEDTQGRALHRHLTQTAGEWQAAGRDPGELYRGARLTAALEWARDHRADLNDLERGFLDAGRAAAEREVADARHRADREARTSRRLRGLLAGLAVVLVLALVAGGLALSLRGRAERQTVVAESRRLGAQSLIQRDLDRSLLLAAEAVHLDDSVDARSALFSSLLRSPQAIWTARGDGNQFEDLALSQDGRTLATVDTHGLLDLWDAQTGRRLAGPLQGANGTYQWFAGVTAFSPDSRQVATGGRAGYGGMQLWDVASRRVIRRLPLEQRDGDDLTDAAFSPDGHLLVAATATGALAFWNPQTDAPIGRVLHPHHPQTVLNAQVRGVSLAFADHGGTLFTSAQGDKTIAWDVTHRRPIREFPLGGALAVSPNGRLLAFGQRDGRIILADARTGQRRRVLTGHTAEAWNLAFSPDSATLVSVSYDSTGIVWDVATGQALDTLRGQNGWLDALAVSPDGTTVYTSTFGDSLMAWDLTGTRGLAKQLARTADNVGGVAFNPRDPDMFALVRSDGPARLWSVARRAPIGTPFPVSTDPLQQTNAVAFRPDGRVLAAEDRTDGTVRLFDLATHARIGVLDATTHPDDVTGVAFSPDGKLLATAGGDGSDIVWDLTKQPPLRNQQYPQPDRPDHWAYAVAFSSDGSTVAWGTDDGMVVLTRVADGTILHTLTVTGSKDTVAASLAFSPDGRTLAAGTWEGHERLWDPSTGTPRGPAWQARGGPIVNTSFSPDGRMLATSGIGSAELWDVASEKQLGALSSGLSTGPTFAAFDPTGHTLVTAFQDGPVLLWAVDPTSWPRRACALAGRRLTQQEWRDFLPGRPYKPSC